MRPEFQVHRLNEAGMAKAQDIAQGFDALLAKCGELAGGESREFSLVKTLLEQACFYAKKAMAMRTENQQQ